MDAENRCIIRAQKSPDKGFGVIRVYEENFTRLSVLAAQTGRTLTSVAQDLLAYALDHATVEGQRGGD